jgi:cytoskeletal protein CcmA (bactofilin family)
MENITEVEEAAVPRGRHRNGASTSNVVVLGPRDSLSGTLSVEGEVRVEGTVEGEVRATGDIHIEQAATVRARLEGRVINVRGNVTGDVVAHQRLSVLGSGTLTGDVRAPRLRVDDGSMINGSITMRPDGADGESSS